MITLPELPPAKRDCRSTGPQLAGWLTGVGSVSHTNAWDAQRMFKRWEHGYSQGGHGLGLQRGGEPLGGVTAFRGANGEESDSEPN